jgi:uncharacterized protein Usg
MCLLFSTQTLEAIMTHDSSRDVKHLSQAPRVDAAFMAQLKGFSLTTAEILYRLPDHPVLLQTFVWQDYDLSPRFPKLRSFLAFWRKNLDGPLCGVRVAHSGLIKPAELRLVGDEFLLH